MNNKLMQFLSICCFISNYAFADDNSIYLDQEQLNQAKNEISTQGNNAINQIPQAQQELGLVNLDKSGVSESVLNQANSAFKHTKGLNNTLPNGDKYYLYSESVVSDARAYVAQNKTPVNINQTIADYNQMSKNAKVQLGDNRLLIFISSSMPKKSIINLMQQGSRVGAVFVIRGLINGSYVDTYRYFYKLRDGLPIGIMINPTLYQAFNITEVPTFAVYKSSTNILQGACKVAPEYSKISGEMTVRYALEQLSKSKINDLSGIANNQLMILENGSFYKGK
jgi:conjugal transfer pilus assembly protein TrbC